jgi:hypothetical protein
MSQETQSSYKTKAPYSPPHIKNTPSPQKTNHLNNTPSNNKVLDQ